MRDAIFTEEEIETLRKNALAHVIPHFANNASLAQMPRIYTRGEGCYVWDIDGRRYLDTFASLLTTVCGHGRREVIEAITQQLELLEFWPNFEDAFTVPLIRLAKKLAEIMPGDLSVSFFVNSGSEANETALKMARQYHVERGEPQRYKVIARRNSYHGTTLGATSGTGLPWFRAFFEPLLPGFLFAPPAYDGIRVAGEPPHADFDPLEAMGRIIEWEGPKTVAAVIMDPIPGSNTGFPLPPKGYLQGVRNLCDKYGILLIFDEVQTGFGKTGKWFACEHWNVVPDIIAIGKGFSAGYVPLGAAVTTPKVAEHFTKAPGHELRTGSTYGGHCLACAAALANIATIEKEHLVERAATMGEYLKCQLNKLRTYPVVADVRGLGLLLAIELMADPKTNKKFDPKLGVGRWIGDWCFARGMIMRNNGDILVMAPALTISKQDIDTAFGLLDQAIPAAMKHFGGS